MIAIANDSANKLRDQYDALNCLFGLLDLFLEFLKRISETFTIV